MEVDILTGSYSHAPLFRPFSSPVTVRIIQIWFTFYSELMLLSESMDLLICVKMKISFLLVISSNSIAFHTENWHSIPAQGEKFTWLVVSFYLITLTITSFTGEKLTPSQCVYYHALTMLRHASWCRHPANSFINDLKVWYSRRKKIEKRVAV